MEYLEINPVLQPIVLIDGGTEQKFILDVNASVVNEGAVEDFLVRFYQGKIKGEPI